MAYRLGDYVVYGELWNTDHYATHGLIAMRGDLLGNEDEAVLRFDLTGDCERDLRGKHIRFQPGEDDIAGEVWREKDHRRFQPMQIGPTGLMTAQGWVRALPCPVEEYIRRCELGEPPPTPWKRRLYLEWYSQNGRVLIEMAGPTVDVCVRESEGEGDEGDWEPLPNLALPPRSIEPGAPVAGPEMTLIRRDGDQFVSKTWTPASGATEEDDDPEFDDPDEAVRDAELIDYCMDECEEKPISSLLDGTDKLRPADELNDVEVEGELKALLAQMALLGIALDVCKHFSPRDCYRLLKEKILRESGAYEELIGTGWVTHICTYEHCKECDAEFEAEYEAEQNRRTE
jgi:hypothetical protein